MSDNNNNNDDENWQYRYAQQRTNVNLSEINEQEEKESSSDNSAKNFLNEDLKRKISMNPFNDYDASQQTSGLDTMNTTDNVVFGNAELAYVVGRHDMKKTSSQLQLKLRSSQDMSLLRQSATSSNHNSQPKTPSSSGNTSGHTNHRSSNSDLTVSTNLLFGSLHSQTPYLHNSSSGSNSNKSRSKRNSQSSKINFNNSITNNNNNNGQDMFESYYKHYNATKPIPVNEAGVTFSPETAIGDMNKQKNLEKKKTRGEEGNTTNEMTLGSNESRTISSKIQQASYQRKTMKGHQLNAKHLSVYQLNPAQSEQISKKVLKKITHLSVVHNVSLKSVALVVFVPVLVPMLTFLVSKSDFIKWSISKEVSLLDLTTDERDEDYDDEDDGEKEKRKVQDNPYAFSSNSAKSMHSDSASSASNYRIEELGYFGLVSMRVSRNLKAQKKRNGGNGNDNDDSNNGREKNVNNGEGDGERHVGFNPTPKYIPLPPMIIEDPVAVDIDYTRLRHYLDTVPDSSSSNNEFLHISLSQWNGFIFRLRLLMWSYFAFWIVGAVVCIVLVIVLT